MALDPALTAEEEDLIRLLRSLQDKESEVAQAEQAAADSTVQASTGRAALRNMREEFVDQMRRRGINNPEALMRRNK